MDLFDIALASKLSGGGGGGGAVIADISFRNQNSIQAINVIGAFDYGNYSSGTLSLLPNDYKSQNVIISSAGMAELYIDPSQIPENYVVEVSGDITDDGNGYYLVGGDGEIIIKSSK